MLLGSRVCSRVKSGWPRAYVQLCDENRSGGLGKSSQAVSESTGSGPGVGHGGGTVSAWRCATGAADTQEEAVARYVGAGPPRSEQAEMAARGVGVVLEGSGAAVMGEVRVGKEGAGSSWVPVRGWSRTRWSRGGRL